MRERDGMTDRFIWLDSSDVQREYRIRTGPLMIRTVPMPLKLVSF